MDDPVAITALDISALEWRRHQAAFLAHDSDALSARAGVLHGLSVSASGLNITVAAGSASISPTAGSNGTYIAVNSAATVLTAAAQHATYARIDRVIVRIYDDEADGSGMSKAEAQIITGTAAASPVAPTLPSGTEEIAQLQVPASGSPIVVVDKRRWAAAAGGVLTVATTALLPSGSALRIGQPAFTTDYGVLWSWTGTRWAPVGTPRFASTAALLAAIASPAVGDAAMVGSDEYRCLTAGSWRLWARPETSWTPTTTGIPVTVNAATYCIQAGRVVGDLRLTATGAATGSITFNPPLTYDITRYTPMGDAVLFDASANTRRVWRTYGGFSDTQQYAVITEGTTATLANATNPWTWASGDEIDIHFSYRPTDAALSI